MPDSIALKLAPSLLLLTALFPGCASTTLADRMPDAAATVQWGIDRTLDDLAAIETDVRTSIQLNQEVRKLLALDVEVIRAGLERARRELRRAEQDVDVGRLQLVVEAMPALREQVSILRRTVIIAEAAARPSPE